MNQNPQLVRIDNNSSALQDALYDYFSGMGGGGGFGGSGGQSAANLNADAGSGGLGGSFSSQRVAGGFLSRAENAAAAQKNDPTSQFDRLDINNNSMRQQ